MALLVNISFGALLPFRVIGHLCSWAQRLSFHIPLWSWMLLKLLSHYNLCTIFKVNKFFDFNSASLIYKKKQTNTYSCTCPSKLYRNIFMHRSWMDESLIFIPYGDWDDYSDTWGFIALPGLYRNVTTVIPWNYCPSIVPKNQQIKNPCC